MTISRPIFEPYLPLRPSSEAYRAFKDRYQTFMDSQESTHQENTLLYFTRVEGDRDRERFSDVVNVTLKSWEAHSYIIATDLPDDYVAVAAVFEDYGDII